MIKMEADLSGKVLEGQGGKRWKVEKLLGSGRCCKAFRTTLMPETAWGALKVYNDGPGYRAARDREAQLISLISRTNQNAPQIVKILDKFDLGGRPCLVQNLLDANITQLVYKNQDDGFSLYVLQKLARDLFLGVNILHQMGFVHGDLKPENLLWSPQDNSLCLIDFSITFHVTDKKIGNLQSSHYRAPEVEEWNQINTASNKPSTVPSGGGLMNHVIPPDMSVTSEARSRVGTASDIWSIGCVLAEMFLGRKLMTHDRQNKTQRVSEDLNLAQALVRQLVKPREDEDEGPQVVQLLADLIHRCLCNDPFQRLTVKQALDHQFFKASFKPSYLDLLLLPTCVVRLLNVIDEKDLNKGQEHLAGLLEDIVEGCKRCGPIKKHVAPTEGKGMTKVYVEYYYYNHSMDAFENLGKRTFNGRTVLLTFFPKEDYDRGNFY